MKVWAVVAAIVLAVPAAAQEAKVGPHPAVTEVTVPFDRRVTVEARLVLDRGGDPAAAVTEPAQLRFEAVLVGGEAPAEVALTCRIVFRYPGGGTSAVVRERPCFAGTVPAGGRVAVDEPLKFRPGRSDPPGATGVELTLREGNRGRGRAVVATYGWQPAAE